MRIVNPGFNALAVVCLCLARLAAQTTAPPNFTPVEAVGDLLRSLWGYEAEGRPNGTRHIGFQLPESVVNLYLVSSLASRPRPMIDRIQVRLLPNNRCMVETKINFDALLAKNSSLFSAPERKKFTGSKSMRTEFHFSLDSGFLVFEASPLESEVVPSQKLLMRIIQMIAANQPERIDTMRKIPVPFGMRKLWTTDGMLHGDT